MRYAIHEDNMERLQTKLATIKKKCDKYGCKFTYEEVGEEFREVTQMQTNGVKTTSLQKFIIVEVDGRAIVEDWEFLATVEHKEHGNIIRTYSDVNIPEHYRTASPICEHCNSKRYRKDTYLIKNTVTGDIKQVGKSCLQDYTNGLSAEAVAKFLSYFDKLATFDNQNAIGAGVHRYISTRDFLNACQAIINVYGYVSRKMAQEAIELHDRIIQTTSSRASDLIFPNRWNEKEVNVMLKKGVDPKTDLVKEQVDKQIAWILNNEYNSVYINNLKILVQSEFSEWRDLGILSSLSASYFKAMETEKKRAEREAKKEANVAKSTHVGSIGDKIETELTYEKTHTFSSDYGICYVHLFKDENDNAFKWTTSKDLFFNDELIEEKTKLLIKATIKKHSEFGGEKQTEITRAKILKVLTEVNV